MSSSTVLTGAVSGLDPFGDGWAVGRPGGSLELCDADLESCVMVTGPGGDVRHTLRGDDDEHLWVLTSASQVWHSSDGGAEWTLIIAGQ